ncbi:MAG: hypothetical protein K9J42_08105 [Sulfuritalea sp.]|nr:hypothetical protein [Sulfuritalea sp.]
MKKKVMLTPLVLFLKMEEAMMRTENRNVSDPFSYLKKNVTLTPLALNRKPSTKALIPRIALAAVAVLLFTACSKTVQWEEEVPLNTGDTILVKRTIKYVYQGNAGNPFDIALRPEFKETIEFTWKAKSYRYEGDARISLLAISPQNYPVLVAAAEGQGWNWVNHYACTIPFYVQLVPAHEGLEWTWPPKIETWLYELPTNLLMARHAPGKMKKRYTADEVRLENFPGAENWPHKQKIDPAFAGDLCKKRK